MLIDQLLPDGHGVAPAADGLGDELAVGLQALTRGARLGRSPDTTAASAVPEPDAGAADESVDTSEEMAGFAGAVRGRPRPRTTTPATVR